MCIHGRMLPRAPSRMMSRSVPGYVCTKAHPHSSHAGGTGVQRPKGLILSLNECS